MSKRAPGEKMTPEARKRIVEAVKARDPKQPANKLAESLGVSPSTLRYYEQRAGKKPRSKKAKRGRSAKQATPRIPSMTITIKDGRTRGHAHVFADQVTRLSGKSSSELVKKVEDLLLFLRGTSWQGGFAGEVILAIRHSRGGP